MADMGVLVPGVGAARWDDDGLDLVDARFGISARFDGVLAAEARAVLEGGEPGPRFRALAHHPGVAAVLRWRDHERRSLSPTAIVAPDRLGILFLELIGRCNERCQHCYAGSGPTIEAELERELALAIIDDACALGFQAIQLTGGDPLLCRFVPELVARCRAGGVKKVEIYTNGLLLSDALLDELEPHRPSFAFSYYASDPDIHDAITRTPASHRRTEAAIQRAVARGLAVRAAMVVMPENEHLVEATVARLRALGVESIAVSPTFGVGRGELYSGQVKASGDGHRGGDRHDRANGSSGKLCVTYEGDVVPCIFNRKQTLGNVRQRRLADIMRAPGSARLPGVSLDALLESCREQLSCLDCRVTACALQMVG